MLKVRVAILLVVFAWCAGFVVNEVIHMKMSEPPDHPNYVRAWDGYYVARVSAQYHKMMQDEEMRQKWSKLAEAYDEILMDPEQATEADFDRLYYERWDLEHIEQRPDLDVLKKAQGLVNLEIYGEEDPE